MCFLTKFSNGLNCHQECVMYVLLNFGKIVQTQCELYCNLIYLERDGQDNMKGQLTHHLKVDTMKTVNGTLNVIINFLITALVHLLLFTQVE